MALVFVDAQDLREKMTLAVWRKSDFDDAVAEAFDEKICLALGLDDDNGFPPFLHEARSLRG
jgi:hypothetical protein